MATRATRPGPNVLVTGTPGTGKTTLCMLVAAALGGRVEHINVSEFVKEKGLHEGWDAEYQCYILDEDKDAKPPRERRLWAGAGVPRQLLDELEAVTEQGWKIVEYHSSELFPERWFELVVVLHTDNTVLFQRLQDRGYTQRKIEENVECEIMQIVASEAHESYKPEIVVDLQSDTLQHMEENTERIVAFFESQS